jgi:hypothetical protein
MSYTMEQSRLAFELVRGLLIDATNETLDVSVIVADTGFAAIITDEQERIEFVSKLGDKNWILSEQPKLAGSFTFTGVAAGDGDIRVSLGSEQYTFTPVAADDAAAIALLCVAAINGGST